MPIWVAERMDHRNRHRQPLRGDGDRILVADLHVCPECSSGLVHPTDWATAGEGHWRVVLRCPECEWSSVGFYEQAVLDRFDQILDAGADSLRADLRKVERMNMEEELRRFSALLDRNLVLPEDF
jgi:hypothetical protein